MKIKSYILSLGVIAVLLSNITLAATTTPPETKRTIILNNKTYSVNICNTKEVDALRIQVIVGTKGQSLATKKRIYTRLKLLQAAWLQTCNSQNTTAIVKNQGSIDSSLTVITNPTYINTLSLAQKNKAIKRADMYIEATESIVNNMISHSVLSSKDKETMKGKIELTYVNDCKKIDGLTTVKQRYDGNKTRVKNELVSISLNISICEDNNFGTLFSSSYKHVLIHELGHYIYYLVDTNTKKFEDICRYNKDEKKPGCTSSDSFHSKYAMNDPQEDYAETFAYWYQGKDPELNLNTVNTNTINLKAQHFSDLYKK